MEDDFIVQLFWTITINNYYYNNHSQHYNMQSSTEIQIPSDADPKNNTTTNTITIEDIFALNNQSLKQFLKYSHHWHHYLDLIERSIDLNLAFKIFLYLTYLFVFFIGIIGNVLVCYVVLRQSSMRTVTNIFITNLALSDILLCLFAVPFTPLYLLAYKEWVFGPIFCRLVPFVQGMSVYISVLTLMSIAIERYIVIIYPFKRHFTVPQCVRIICFIWLLALILTLPYGIFIDVIPIPVTTQILQSSLSNHIYHHHQNETNLDVNRHRSLDSLRNMLQNIHKRKWYCDEVWPNDRLRLAFGITTSVIQFVIPFVIITFCYAKVFLRLWDRMRNRLVSRNYSSQRQWLEKERARRTNLMLIFMVVIFVVSWLPLNTYNLIEDFYIQITYWKHSRALFMIFHLVAMSSTCYNPFLYTWLNDNFRKEFHSIFSPLLQRIHWFLFVHQNRNNPLHKDLRNDTSSKWGRKQSPSIQNNTEADILPGILSKDYIDSTRITRLNLTNDHAQDDDGELISMTNIDTTTNMVTNLESINEVELQESLFITSLQNGVLASRIIHNNNNNNNNNNSNHHHKRSNDNDKMDQADNFNDTNKI